MAKKKYYAVAAGRTTGIFTDWPSAEKQVKGCAGAKFKSFPTEEQAKKWLDDPVYESRKKKSSSKHETVPAVSPSSDSIVVYTDGGSINNPGPGGYGVVIAENGSTRELSGGYRLTTNNRMEMMGAIVALKSLKGSDEAKKIHLYSDSSYLVNGITKGWAVKWRRKGWLKSDGQPALNVDLWKELLDLLSTREVTFTWIKGHAGNEFNERCDQLAVGEARANPEPIDKGYEQAR